MINKKYKYIYGPVNSWRLGSSLGVDLISSRSKICTFDCIYCQLGRRKAFDYKRKIFVPTSKIINEIKQIYENDLLNKKVDYITFSGTGEPTLAKNLGTVIDKIRKMRKESIAVLTNASLIYREDVQKDLLKADLVMAKLDAGCEDTLFLINNPAKEIDFKKIINGIKRFKRKFKGKLALQVMFLKQNKDSVNMIAKSAKEIKPDEIQINTPLRPSSAGFLSKNQISQIRKKFKGIRCKTVYDKRKRKIINPVDSSATNKRRGN